MDSTWVVALISGLSGVGGAFVGASAAVWMHRREMRSAQEAERKAALVGFWAAVNKVAGFNDLWGRLHPGERFGKDMLLNIRTLGSQGRLIERGWHVHDEFWAASGRAHAVASADELAAISRVEDALADWTFGEPMPDAWGPAIQGFRLVMQSARLPTPNSAV